MQQTVAERIKILVEKYGSKPADFAKATGLTNQNVYDLTSGRKGDPSFASFKKILIALPNVNERWLMLGEGEMLKTPTQNAGVPKFSPYMSPEITTLQAVDLEKEIGELITPLGAGSEGINSQLQTGEPIQQHGRPIHTYSTPHHPKKDTVVQKSDLPSPGYTPQMQTQQEPAGMDLIRQVAQYGLDIKELKQAVNKLIALNKLNNKIGRQDPAN